MFKAVSLVGDISRILNLDNKIKIKTIYYYVNISSIEDIVDDCSLLAFCLFFTIKEVFKVPSVTLEDIAQAFKFFGYNINDYLILKLEKKYREILINDL